MRKGERTCYSVLEVKACYRKSNTCSLGFFDADRYFLLERSMFMIIKQILNNNVVISENESGEVIVVGKGIGFHGKAGEEIDISKIEKTYLLQSEEENSSMKLLLSEIPYEIISFGIKATDYIIRCSRKKISRRILIPLTDHIYSCLGRYKEGIKFSEALRLNVAFLYPEEYKIATDIIDMIDSDFGIRVKDEEAAFITLHIVNAEMDIDLKDTYAATDIISIGVDTVEKHYNIKLENTADAARFITHLRFFAQRMISNAAPEEDISEINRHVNLRYPDAYSCAEEIAEAIEEKYHYPIDKNEKTYLTIHIARLIR